MSFGLLRVEKASSLDDCFLTRTDTINCCFIVKIHLNMIWWCSGGYFCSNLCITIQNMYSTLYCFLDNQTNYPSSDASQNPVSSKARRDTSDNVPGPIAPVPAPCFSTQPFEYITFGVPSQVNTTGTMGSSCCRERSERSVRNSCFKSA